MCHSFSFLLLWCSYSGQRPGAVLGGPADPSAVLEIWGEQLGPISCPFSPLISWRLPAGCGAVQVLCCPCVALAHCLLAPAMGSRIWQCPPIPSWANNMLLQEEACGCLSSCISGCGEILGKSEILTGLEETSSVCGNSNCAPNQGGKQNPRPNRKALRASQPPPAPLTRAEQRDPQLPCLG